jgi:peptide/nickel transport system substrate-binding protein
VKKASLLIPAFFAVFLLSCGRIGAGPDEISKYGGVLAAGIRLENRDPDSPPFKKAAKLLYSSIYETLVCLVTGIDGPQPMLAESWEISDDRLEYIFHIKNNIVFHDKTPLDAQSAAASLKRLERAGPVTGKPYRRDNRAVSNIRDVSAAEKYILKITLYRPDPYFLFYMTDSETAVKLSGSSSGGLSFPAGTGPFMISSVSDSEQDGLSVFTDRFGDYYGKKAYLDRIVFRFFPEGNALYPAVKAGDIDLIEIPDVNTHEKAVENRLLKTYSVSGGEVFYLFFNPESFFFRKKELRLAAAHAFDRNTFIEEAFGSKPVSSADNFPYPFRFTGPGSDRIPFDPEKSQTLIYDSRYKNILNPSLYIDGAADSENTASAIKKLFENAGIMIKVFSENSADADWDNPSFPDIYASGWLNIRENPSGFDKWDVPDDIAYSDLLYSALTAGDQEASSSFYTKAADYLAEEVSRLSAACSLNIYSMGLNVTGVSFRPDGIINTADLWIKKQQ